MVKNPEMKNEMNTLYNQSFSFIIQEPQREKTHRLASTPNEDSNQPAHQHSLISPYKVHPWLSKMCPVKNAQSDLNLRLAHTFILSMSLK